MLLKSLEFKNAVGQKVKITEIPVLDRNSPFYFMIQVRLQALVTDIYESKKSVTNVISFREYLKGVIKWSVYRQLFKNQELKNNA